MINYDEICATYLETAKVSVLEADKALVTRVRELAADDEQVFQNILQEVSVRLRTLFLAQSAEDQEPVRQQFAEAGVELDLDTAEGEPSIEVVKAAE